jgi:proline racemase
VTHLIRSIDAHVGGQAVRLVTEGVPGARGSTMSQRVQWLRRHADHVRRAVVLEPRGHADLIGAQLVEPGAPGAHAGVIFMGAGGFTGLSGSGIMAVATIAIERELFFARDAHEGGDLRLAFETAAGSVSARCRVHVRGSRARVDSVAFGNVPAFVQAAGHRISLDGRELRVDVAYGGAGYAIVDTEAVGIPLVIDRVPDLRRLAAAIVRTLSGPSRDVTRANDGVSGVVFTGPPQDPEAHLRAVTIRDGLGVNRSPGGTSMSAVMSVLDAMGLLPDDQPFVQEGLVGSLFRGRVVARTEVESLPAIATEIEGTAHVTGEHTFWLDEDDPFREGFVV